MTCKLICEKDQDGTEMSMNGKNNSNVRRSGIVVGGDCPYLL